jgi:hypothetical protein
MYLRCACQLFFDQRPLLIQKVTNVIKNPASAIFRDLKNKEQHEMRPDCHKQACVTWGIQGGSKKHPFKGRPPAGCSVVQHGRPYRYFRESMDTP